MALFSLAILFLVASVFSYTLFGVKVVNDSQRYLGYASHLQEGFYFEKHNFWYIGYVLFILVVRLLTDSYHELYIVLCQYLYSFIGLSFLYKMMRALEIDRASSLIGSVLYMALVEFSAWNSYILCESFYLNNIVISGYFLVVTFVQKKITTINSLCLLFFSLLTAFSKPTGIVVLLSIACIVSIYFVRQSKVGFWFTSTWLFFGLALFTVLANKMMDTFLIVENYSTGEIIYAISTVPYLAQYPELVVNVPNDLKVLTTEYPPAVRLVHFVFVNFSFWCALFMKKVFYFLAHVRPYWSLKHNLFNLILILPTYIISIIQIIKSKSIVKNFCVCYLLLHTLIVGLTSVDWDGRFFLPLTPILVILVAKRVSKTLMPQ